MVDSRGPRNRAADRGGSGERAVRLTHHQRDLHDALRASVLGARLVELEGEVPANVGRYRDARVERSPQRARSEARGEVAVRDDLACRVEDAPNDIRLEDPCRPQERQIRARAHDVEWLRSGNGDPVTDRTGIPAELDDELGRVGHVRPPGT